MPGRWESSTASASISPLQTRSASLWKAVGGGPGSGAVRLRTAAIEVSQAEGLDLILNIVVGGGMDGLAKFLDEQFEELGPGPLERLPEGLGGDLGAGLLTEPEGDLLDRFLGVVASEVEDRGVSVLGGLGLVGL